MSLPKRARPNRSTAAAAADSTSSSSSSSSSSSCKVRSYVVVGGGIAGVSCAKELQRYIDSYTIGIAGGGDSGDTYDTIVITLVSSTAVLKESVGVMKISKFLEELDVYERSCDHFSLDNPKIRILRGFVCSIDHVCKELHLDDGRIIPYDKVCLCTGALPRLLSSTICKNIIGIRDIDSVADLMHRLESRGVGVGLPSRPRKVLVVGNGGIALELVNALVEAENSCSVDWLVRDSYAGKSFFDASAAAFVMPSLKGRLGGSRGEGKSETERVTLVGTTNVDGNTPAASEGPTDSYARRGGASVGAALGPDWLFKSNFIDNVKRGGSQGDGVMAMNVHFNEEIVSFYDNHYGVWITVDNSSNIKEAELNKMMEMAKEKIDVVNTYPLRVLTATGTLYSCDFIVSATGVTPSTAYVPRAQGDFLLDIEGGLIVDRKMRTNIDDVYAAGDCCNCKSCGDTPSSNWFQMRLWSQARCAGIYAAHCMLGVEDSYGSDYFFELFAHVTRFFGYKVVLLGRYNCQGLGDEMEDRVKELVVTESGLVRRDRSHPYAQGRRYSGSGGVADTDLRRGLAVSHSSKEDPSLQLWTRVTAGKEYIKLVVKEGRVIGALLIGDTGIEETIENLILNQLDVSQQGIELLNPDVDIEDYFD